jgi:protein-S-isoprenylcysteine O-methyltransferase Ste14
MLVWTVLSKFAFLVGLIWLVSEIVLARVTLSKSDKAKGLDRSSLRFLWLIIGVSLGAGIYLGSRGIGYIPSGSLVISVAGLVLIFLGLAIRWTAILTLRKHFTVNVNIGDSHQLIDTGIYHFVRHPSYTGSLVSFLGLGLTFSNWLCVLVIFIPIFVAFAYRIKVEEQALREHFGDKYEQYCRQTRRLLPLIY